MMFIAYYTPPENIVEQTCPLCGYAYKLKLSKDEMERYNNYQKKGGYIQEELPTLNPVEREFIKTGYCPDCQEIIFGNGKTNRITPLKQTSEEC